MVRLVEEMGKRLRGKRQPVFDGARAPKLRLGGGKGGVG